MSSHALCVNLKYLLGEHLYTSLILKSLSKRNKKNKKSVYSNKKYVFFTRAYMYILNTLI